MEIAKVGVVGCGTMGSGICEIVARAGFPVAFLEVSPAQVEAGRERIRASLQRAVDRDKIDEAERDDTLGRITGDTSYDVFADADLVIEAIPESLALKQEAFRELDRVLKPEAVLATNTSSLPVIDLAVQTKRSNRILGFHFFNPAPVMPLIELVKTVVTDPDVVDDARAFADSIGKTPVVAQDRAGFIANLLLFPYLNHAIAMLESGYATREDIDAAMQLGCGHPMGPLALMDLIGLDSGNAIMETIYRQFGDVRHAPRPIVRQLLAAGFKGRKTAKGFYEYAEANSSRIVRATRLGAEDEPERREPDAGAISGWRTIGVLGSGTMATGIAEVCAKAGFAVVLRARSPEKAAKTLDRVQASLAKAVDRGKLSPEDRDTALERLQPTDDFGELADCDLVIEAVAEDIDIKRALFSELDAHTKPDALLATTTSSLPVIDCAMATGRPERVIGLHFFNPTPIMRLVEVIHTTRTDPAALEQSRALVDRLGKTGVVCRDRAGFIVNALLFPYLNDAVKMLAEGYATVKDIDNAMKLGCGHPMGPFELMDIVGLDVTLEIIRALHAEFREPGLQPAPLLGYMVSAGYLGRKVGRGFHVYD